MSGFGILQEMRKNNGRKWIKVIVRAELGCMKFWHCRGQKVRLSKSLGKTRRDAAQSSIIDDREASSLCTCKALWLGKFSAYKNGSGKALPESMR